MMQKIVYLIKFCWKQKVYISTMPRFERGIFGAENQRLNH